MGFAGAGFSVEDDDLHLAERRCLDVDLEHGLDACRVAHAGERLGLEDIGDVFALCEHVMHAGEVSALALGDWLDPHFPPCTITH